MNKQEVAQVLREGDKVFVSAATYAEWYGLDVIDDVYFAFGTWPKLEDFKIIHGELWVAVDSKLKGEKK